MSFENELAFTINAVTQECVDVLPVNGKDFKLAELYQHCSCDLIQIVEIPHKMTGLKSKSKWVMVIDEEGKVKSDTVLNHLATTLYHDSWDVIVGDVLVCPSKMVK
jgi:hypothetical protein